MHAESAKRILKPENNGWTAFEEAEPKERDCLLGCILVWHRYRGVVSVKWERRRETPMYTHWKPMPRQGWISRDVQLPTKADADITNCVLIMQGEEGITVTGWHQMQHNKNYNQWMPTPLPPQEAFIYQQTI